MINLVDNLYFVLFFDIVGVLLVLILLKLVYDRLSKIKILHPNALEELMLLILRNEIMKGIAAAERKTRDLMLLADATLDGVDRKALADRVYALFPDNFYLFGISISTVLLKRFCNQEMFESLVQTVYDEWRAWLAKNEAALLNNINSIAPKSGDHKPVT